MVYFIGCMIALAAAFIGGCVVAGYVLAALAGF